VAQETIAFLRKIEETQTQPFELRPEPFQVARTGHLASGTLACPRCDAPVALATGPAAPADPLGCPYCAHAATVRDFLSLGDPTRPARVAVRVVHY
jgi:hypothetical protein